MSTINSVMSQIQSDIDLANNTTKKSDNTLHDAVVSLIAGFGGGSSDGTAPILEIPIHKLTMTKNLNDIEFRHNLNIGKYFYKIQIKELPTDTSINTLYLAEAFGFINVDGIDTIVSSVKNTRRAGEYGYMPSNKSYTNLALVSPYGNANVISVNRHTFAGDYEVTIWDLSKIEL